MRSHYQVQLHEVLYECKDGVLIMVIKFRWNAVHFLPSVVATLATK